VRHVGELGLTFYRVEGEGEKAAEAVGVRSVVAGAMNDRWGLVRRWREGKGKGWRVE
jgi:hypothetical protein